MSSVQRDELMVDQQAMQLVLNAVPGAKLTEHHADELRMLGSLYQIATASPEEIQNQTQLTPVQCALNCLHVLPAAVQTWDLRVRPPGRRAFPASWQSDVRIAVQPCSQDLIEPWASTSSAKPC